MLTKAEKSEIVKEFNDKFISSPTVLVFEYKGLKVIEMQKLRRDLRKANAEIRVVKNSLLKLAAKETNIDQIGQLFEGPTAIAICDEPTTAAKVFVDSKKNFPAIKIKGGFLEGKVVDQNEIIKISQLPTREELISQFAGLLIAPMSNFVGTLSQLQARVIYALNALKEKKENNN